LKIETLWELLQDERYACLTVTEFVEIIKDAKVMEENEPTIINSNMLDWLEKDFNPTKVIYHTNKDIK